MSRRCTGRFPFQAIDWPAWRDFPTAREALLVLASARDGDRLKKIEVHANSRSVGRSFALAAC
jgi:hypothetical protein